MSNSWSIVGRFGQMPEGQFFLMTPDGDPTRWTEAQADDVLKQVAEGSQDGMPTLEKKSGPQMAALVSGGLLVSSRGLRLSIMPRN